MRAIYFVVLQQNNLGRRFFTSKMHYLHPSCLGCCPLKSDGPVVVVVVVESLFIVAAIVFGDSLFGPCFVIQYFVSLYFCNHLNGEVRAVLNRKFHIRKLHTVKNWYQFFTAREKLVPIRHISLCCILHSITILHIYVRIL